MRRFFLSSTSKKIFSYNMVLIPSCPGLFNNRIRSWFAPLTRSILIRYLLNGSEYSLLIDTGLGICNIHDQVMKLTDKPVIAVATHIHWDHIGGHKFFPDFYAHKAELNWLAGEFP